MSIPHDDHDSRGVDLRVWAAVALATLVVIAALLGVR